MKEAVRRVAAAFKTGEGNVVAVSAQTRLGRETVLSVLDGVCSRAAEREENAQEDAE